MPADEEPGYRGTKRLSESFVVRVLLGAVRFLDRASPAAWNVARIVDLAEYVDRIDWNGGRNHGNFLGHGQSLLSNGFAELILPLFRQLSESGGGILDFEGDLLHR